MTEYILIGLGLVVLLGFTAQWISWRLKVPSIILLLIFGILAGPVAGYLEPDRLLGDVLIPFVSISVAIILFEGGLTLKLSEYREIGRVVILLVSVGILVSWVVSAAAAYLLFGLTLKMSVLLGAVLIVTGPTVMKPMLHHIRPSASVGKVLRWEGILIDPIGAMLAILTFEAIRIGEVQAAAVEILLSLLKTVALGAAIGWTFAWLLTLLIRRYWIPDFLHEAAALTAVVVAYFISDYFQRESGLLTATVMGIFMANQKNVSIKKIKDFKENLTVLMIPFLFILLSARLTPENLKLIGFSGLAFLLVLVLVGRPLSVFFSTLGSGLDNKEKLFLAWMAPRGIVAAAMSSVIALKLSELNVVQIEYLVPVTFLVIIGTVFIYSLTSPAVARKLNISQPDPSGVLIAGAHEWARQIAMLLKERGVEVIMLDTNRHNIRKAKMEGFTAYTESITSSRMIDKLNFDRIGKLMAMTSNDEVNALAVLHFSEIFDNENLYQLQPDKEDDEREYYPQHLRGRFLFPKGVNYSTLTERLSQGANIKSSHLTEKYTYQDFKEKYGDSMIPLLLIDTNGHVQPFNLDEEFKPVKDTFIIALVD